MEMKRNFSFSNIILPSQSESFCVNGVSIKVSCTVMAANKV